MKKSIVFALLLIMSTLEILAQVSAIIDSLKTRIQKEKIELQRLILEEKK